MHNPRTGRENSFPDRVMWNVPERVLARRPIRNTRSGRRANIAKRVPCPIRVFGMRIRVLAVGQYAYSHANMCSGNAKMCQDRSSGPLICGPTTTTRLCLSDRTTTTNCKGETGPNRRDWNGRGCTRQVCNRSTLHLQPHGPAATGGTGPAGLHLARLQAAIGERDCAQPETV